MVRLILIFMFFLINFIDIKTSEGIMLDIYAKDSSILTISFKIAEINDDKALIFSNLGSLILIDSNETIQIFKEFEGNSEENIEKLDSFLIITTVTQGNFKFGRDQATLFKDTTIVRNNDNDTINIKIELPPMKYIMQ